MAVFTRVFPLDFPDHLQDILKLFHLALHLICLVNLFGPSLQLATDTGIIEWVETGLNWNDLLTRNQQNGPFHERFSDYHSYNKI